MRKAKLETFRGKYKRIFLSPQLKEGHKMTNLELFFNSIIKRMKRQIQTGKR